MSIKTSKGEKFSFISDNGLEAIAPTGADVYVHITDGGNGTHSAYAKIRKPSEAEGHPKQELGFHRGEVVTFPSNEPELFAKAHEAIKAQLEVLNPNVEFVID